MKNVFHLNVVGVHTFSGVPCVSHNDNMLPESHTFSLRSKTSTLPASQWADSMCSLARLTWADFVWTPASLKQGNRSNWPCAAAVVLFQGFMFPSLSQMLTSSSVLTVNAPVVFQVVRAHAERSALQKHPEDAANPQLSKLPHRTPDLCASCRVPGIQQWVGTSSRQHSD